MEQPFVSICLLTYNRAKLLPRSLDAILGQTYQNFELIINDDCSPDETGEVAKEYEKRDSRVRYCRNETNQRYAGNQNMAIARAKSDLVAIMHDGDIYRPDCIEQWVRIMATNPMVGLVYNATDGLDEQGKVAKQYRHPYPSVMPGKKMLDETLRLNSSPIFGIVMVRKNFVQQVGPFDTQFPVLADVDMWMRLMMVSDIGYVNEPLFQISPREGDHINQGINWKILREQQQIFQTNLMRRFPVGHEREVALKKLRGKFALQILQALLWCAKRKRWDLFYQGVIYMTRSGNLELRMLGWTLRPLLRVVVSAS